MYRHCRNLIQRPSISILSIMIGTCHTHTVREGTGDRGQKPKYLATGCI